MEENENLLSRIFKQNELIISQNEKIIKLLETDRIKNELIIKGLIRDIKINGDDNSRIYLLKALGYSKEQISLLSASSLKYITDEIINQSRL
mgnify:CR=1 FL=1|nr:MAG TPA: hypothetical protein [Caudoviricetes sp.]